MQWVVVSQGGEIAFLGSCELLHFLSTLHPVFLLKINICVLFRFLLFNREESLPISISLLSTQSGSSTAFPQFVKRFVHLYFYSSLLVQTNRTISVTLRHILNCWTSFPQKLANISLRIQQIETTLCILEAKVSSWASTVILSHSIHMSCPCTDRISNIAMLWAAVLHSWAGGRHNRWTQSAATCSGQRTHYGQSEPHRWSSSSDPASPRGKYSDMHTSKHKVFFSHTVPCSAYKKSAKCVCCT